MKKKKYILFSIIFLIIMTFILLFFIKRYESISLKNTAKVLLFDLENYDTGNYIIKNGIVYTDNNSIISYKKYENFNGNIIIDKYKNTKFLINHKNKCISKTSLGNIIIDDNKCGDFKTINVEIVKNNANVFFKTNQDDLSYMISNKDNFQGEWISENYKDLITLKRFNEKENYIWFKDEDGNISDVIKFEINCLNTHKADYNSGVFYCSGSTVYIDNIEWVVIKDNNDSILLMKFLPLDKKISHCTDTNENVFSDENTYKWSKSYINFYLNNIFIEKLSDELKNKLLTFNICDEYNYNGTDSYLGFLKSESKDNCNSFIESKIKIISYDEFNYLYSYSKNKDVINGNYWAINSFEKNYGSSIQYNKDFYVLENLCNKLDIKPVILVGK